MLRVITSEDAHLRILFGEQAKSLRSFRVAIVDCKPDDDIVRIEQPIATALPSLHFDLVVSRDSILVAASILSFVACRSQLLHISDVISC